MLDNATIANLNALKLLAFAQGLQEQRGQPEVQAMTFEERLAFLVDRELNDRSERKRTRLLQKARLKIPTATLEDADFAEIRGLDRKTLTGLALSGWIERGDTILFGGATGVGKTWLACAMAQYACRRGHSALYLRVPRLAEELRVLHASGALRKWLAELARTDVLVLDDWGTGSIDATTRADLLEVIDDRAGQRATVITHQLPVDHWHGWIGDATIADAILDRLLPKAHRFNLEGPSRRGPRLAKTAKAASRD
ncbi:MAG TPA: IS21-like element helper ATPase IstB [Vicinamibacterales bacterium]|jgi:DNA replication protein DnaC|nr:IS21-like element helper ATPase IstB [Vicinamibacterales bacterium]